MYKVVQIVNKDKVEAYISLKLCVTRRNEGNIQISESEDYVSLADVKEKHFMKNTVGLAKPKGSHTNFSVQ